MQRMICFAASLGYLWHASETGVGLAQGTVVIYGILISSIGEITQSFRQLWYLIAFLVAGHSIFQFLSVVQEQGEVFVESDFGICLIALFTLITSVVQVRRGREEKGKFEFIQNPKTFEVIYL